MDQAKLNPDIGIIGCEPYINGLAMLLRKLSDHPCNNVRLYDGDARNIFDVLPKSSIEKVFLLYPDPWPKKRHSKRRLINVNFFYKVIDFLKKDAIIHIASDSKLYISDILHSIYQVKTKFKWINQNKNEWDYLNLSLPQTKYFQKALKNGLNPFFAKLEKI